jgi:anti-anti-sigma factor
MSDPGTVRFRAEIEAGEVPVLRLGGELDLSTTEIARSVAESAISAKAPRLVVDLTELTFIDSAGLGFLVALAKRIPDVELRHPSENVRRVLEMTGLTEVLRLAG